MVTLIQSKLWRAHMYVCMYVCVINVFCEVLFPAPKSGILALEVGRAGFFRARVEIVLHT
jgi:hypothetical protein